MGNIHPSMEWLRDQFHALESEVSEDGGIYALKSGYHGTRQDNEHRWPGNYSIRDSIDRRGPADKAAAIDWTFHDAQKGKRTTITTYCDRLWEASRNRDPRLAGWREWYGTRDGSTVTGYDLRNGHEVTSDKTHTWHIHFSEVRAHVESQTNKEALLSVLKGESLADYIGRGGQLVTGQTTPTPTPGPTALAVDGDLGPKTIRRWQETMHTPVDGVISATSDLVMAVQRHLNAHGAKPKLVVDGKGIRQDGKVYKTAKALQKYLGTPADGIIDKKDSAVVRALQRRLNEGRF